MKKSILLFLYAAVFTAYALTKNEAELHKAAAAGDVKKVQSTLKQFNKKKDNINASGSERDQYTERGGWTALYLAAVKGHTEVVQVLLAAGASAAGQIDEGFGEIHCFVADVKDKPEILDLFLQAGGGSACAALFSGPIDKAFAAKLLSGGLDANADHLGLPLLLKTVEDERADLVEVLIANKANVNYRMPKDSNYEDKAGKSVLDIAKRGKNQKIIDLLKAAGAK